MRQRILTLLLSACLLLALAGCTGGGSTASSGSSQSAADATPTPAPTPVVAPPASGETAQDVGAFDLEQGTVLLNNGIEMPVLGIGTFRLSDEEAENSVYWALRDGYRLIDTARIYGNEEGVGRGIRRAIEEGLVTREEIFVTTKLWTSDYDLSLIHI